MIKLGKEKKEKIAKLAFKKQEEERKMATMKKIGQESEQLAAKLGSSQERLFQPVGNFKGSTLRDVEEKHTYQPKINSALPVESVNAARIYGDAEILKPKKQKRMSVAQSVDARNEAWAKAKEERAKKLAEKYKKNEDEEMTFQPKVKGVRASTEINIKTHRSAVSKPNLHSSHPLIAQYQAAGKSGQLSPRSAEDIYSASEKWRLDKEKKIEELRKEKERKEAEVSTYKFKPTKYKMKSPRKSVFATGATSPKRTGAAKGSPGYADRATYHRKDSGGWNTAPVERLPNGRSVGFGAGNPKSKLKKKSEKEMKEDEVSHIGVLLGCCII